MTAWNRREVSDNVVLRLQRPPFAGQPDNSLRLNRQRARRDEFRRELTPTNAVAAHALHLEALQGQPDDFRWHWDFAEFLEATRDLPRATEEWRQVQARLPHPHVGAYQVGRLLAEPGRREEARQWLNRAVALRPDRGSGGYELDRLSLAAGAHEQALRHFARAGRLVPHAPRVPLQMAKTLA